MKLSIKKSLLSSGRRTPQYLYSIVDDADNQIFKSGPNKWLAWNLKREAQAVINAIENLGLDKVKEKFWSQFAHELIEFECPTLLDKVDVNKFGVLMVKVISKYGHAESVLWNTKTPIGTEDRTWVRTWLYTLGFTDRYNLQSFDSDHMKRILDRFEEVQK